MGDASADAAPKYRVMRRLRLDMSYLDSLPVAFCVSDVIDPAQPLLFCSPGFCQLTGYEFSEIIGRNCNFLQGPESDPRTRQFLRERISGGEPCTVPVLNYRADRTKFWNLLTMQPLCGNAASGARYYVGIQVDVTDYLHARPSELAPASHSVPPILPQYAEAVRQPGAISVNLRAVGPAFALSAPPVVYGPRGGRLPVFLGPPSFIDGLAGLPQGFTIADARTPGLPIVFASRGFLGMTGYSLEEVLGRNCSFLQGEGTAACTLGEIREALRDRRSITRIVLNYAKDGTPFYNLLTLAPVLGREAVKLLKRRMKRGRAKGASVPRADVASRLPDAVAALRVGSDDDEETVEEDRRRLGAKEKSNAEPLFFAGLQVDVTDYPDLSATALQLNSEIPLPPVPAIDSGAAVASDGGGPGTEDTSAAVEASGRAERGSAAVEVGDGTDGEEQAWDEGLPRPPSRGGGLAVVEEDEAKEGDDFAALERDLEQDLAGRVGSEQAQHAQFDAADMAEASARARSWLDEQGYDSRFVHDVSAGRGAPEQAGAARDGAVEGPVYGPELPFRAGGDEPTVETGAAWTTPGNSQPQGTPKTRGTVTGPAAMAGSSSRVRQRPHNTPPSHQHKRRCTRGGHKGDVGENGDDTKPDGDTEEDGSVCADSKVEVSSGKRAHGCSMQ